jgi:hypothetical protein
MGESMKYVFDQSQLEEIKWCMDNHGVEQTFRVVHYLSDSDTIPVDDMVDFNQQFKTQYTQTFGCGY